jgi:predicted alpha/beta superfamily hydrolase
MVHKWDVTIPRLTGDTPRRAYIWLPDSYETKANKRYPVMYMFDGHNVFFDSDATYGKSWGMAKYMEQTRKQFIIVGIECNHDGAGRLQEYSPVSFENELGLIRGRGRTYMDWLTGTLKPYIDENYRTLPNRRHTILAGSSMGGLMALYGAVAYNHVFQRAACLSPSLWVAPDKMLGIIERAHIRDDTCIYMDYGSKEMANHPGNPDALMRTANLLLHKQVDLTFRIVPGGEHCEASWEKQIPVFLGCLGL